MNFHGNSLQQVNFQSICQLSICGNFWKIKFYDILSSKTAGDIFGDLLLPSCGHNVIVLNFIYS